MYGQRRFHCYLSIPPEEMLRYYRGEAQQVLVHTQEGLSVELAAAHLRPFITSSGISGHFELIVSSQNKFIALNKLS